MRMGQMLAILTVLNNKHFGFLCHTLQGAKQPGTAHQSEETSILIAEDEINVKSQVNLPSTNTQPLADQQKSRHGCQLTWFA